MKFINPSRPTLPPRLPIVTVPKQRTILDIIDDVDAIEKLSNEELKALCAPLFPDTRTPIMCPSKVTKTTNMDKLMADQLAKNRELLNQMRAARGTKT